MTGEYWCQAIVANSSGQYLATESNILTVLRPEDYDGVSVCNNIQSVVLQKCAVVSSNGYSSQSSVTLSYLMSAQVEESYTPASTMKVKSTLLQAITSTGEPG